MIDDEQDFLDLVSFRLKKSGYDVLLSADGEDGLVKVRAERPDLVLLDLGLPRMSGQEVCTEIKKDEKMKSTPVIFLSANADRDIDAITKDLSAQGYISKPFQPDELMNVIERNIG